MPTASSKPADPRRPAIRILLALATILSAGNPSAAQPPATAAFDGRLRVILDDALIRDHQRHRLILNLEARDGRWLPAWGIALTWNNGTHHGFVDTITATDRQLHLRLALQIEGDLHLPEPTLATYDLILHTGESGHHTGTFTGRHQQHPVHGTARATASPSAPLRKPDWTAPEPGERPRLLFRRSDLPALRKKLDTPLGAAWRATVTDDPVGLGILYQLTGDQTHADRAAAIIRSRGHTYRDHHGGGEGANFGHRPVSLMLTYDLCADAWPDDLVRQIRAFGFQYVPDLQLGLMSAHANYHPCSNYHGPGRGAAGIAALAIWGEPGPRRPPRPPTDPLDRPVPITPDPTPAADGEPVVPLTPGITPDTWLILGPLPTGGRADPLKNAGGTGRARLREGQIIHSTRLTDQGITHHRNTVRRLPTDRTDNHRIDLTGLAPDEPDADTLILYTAIRVTEPTTLAAACPADTTMHLGPHRLEDHTWYRLAPGLHRLTVTTPAGRRTLAPRLVPPGDPAVIHWPDAVDLARRLWHRRRATAARGMHPLADHWIRKSHHQLFQHYRFGIGTGGTGAETGSYADWSGKFPALFASAWLNVTGRPPSPHPDISVVVPRRIMQTLFPRDRPPRSIQINAATGLDPAWFALTWPLVPDHHRPGVLWAWNRLLNIDHPDDIPNLIARTGTAHAARHLAFLHYPLDLAPVHPRHSLPRTWTADTYGLYLARNGWEGQQDIIAQIFLKSRPIWGWNHPNAGAITLDGLGHTWTAAQRSRNGVRERETVVFLPDDPDRNWSGSGHVTHLETHDDGTLILTADLSEIYAPARPRGGYFDRNLERTATVAPDATHRGRRAVAFDHSRLSGAPLLMVLLDQVPAAIGRKQWLWQLPGQPGDPAPRVTLDHRGFTLAQPDGANLRATFIAPRPVTLTLPNRTSIYGRNGGLSHIICHDENDRTLGPPPPPPHDPDRVEHRWHSLMATGSDTYYVILTLQHGPAPTIHTQGQGLDTRITIGRRTIHWDGEKIVLGEK